MLAEQELSTSTVEALVAKLGVTKTTSATTLRQQNKGASLLTLLQHAHRA